MGPAAMETLRTFVLLTALWGHMAVETDRDFRMCGEWIHSRAHPQLLYTLTPGCDVITVSANDSALSVQGSITAHCSNQSSWPLKSSQGRVSFCLVWEPLLDMLTLQANGENITLCHAHGLQPSCCAHLSATAQRKSSMFGIQHATVHGDGLRSHVMAEYSFKGDTANCMQEFCGKAEQEPDGANMIEEAVLKSGVMGTVELPCAHSTVMELKEDFTGHTVTLDVPGNVPPNRIPSVHLPAGLRPAQRKTAKVVCTHYTNSTLFQMSSNNILEDVVGISVENEIITDLPHPIIIIFHHSGIIQETHTAKCVSWDTRTDPELRWREEGCVTVSHGAQETHCHCYHLTYFAILVQVNPTTLRHLEVLTFITAVGCALSAVSCVVLFVSLCRQKRAADQSSLVHRGLVVSLFFLCVLFVLTGTVANVGHERVCHFMGALLHYVLLSSLCWMAVEVLHTFQMVHMVFSLSPKTWIWYLLGFGVPVVPVVILASMGNIYGQRTITQSDGAANPYHMCWMLDSHAALVAHCITTVGLLAAVITSGTVMLFRVIWAIHNRPEWRKSVAFLSIWGLSCLFGSTWALTFFTFGPLSETVLFLFCIINSLQGFFLMLRFYVLARIQKRSKNISDGSSSGSTRHQMLQEREREKPTTEDG